MKYVDLNYLKQFAGGDTSFMINMIDMFISNTPELIEKMENGIKEQDWEKVRAAAHKMKSSVDIIGSAKLKENLEKIEDYSAKEENLEEIPELVKETREVCSVAIEELKQEKAALA